MLDKRKHVCYNKDTKKKTTKRLPTMLITYARYIYTNDFIGKKLNNKWYKVSKEYMTWYPSGRHTTLVIDGVAVKARHCEIVQVFTK